MIVFKDIGVTGGVRFIPGLKTGAFSTPTPHACKAPSGKAISELVSGLGQNGQMIIVTYVNETMRFSPANLMGGGRSIRGWVGGNPEDALRFSALTGVRPMVEVFPLEQAALAFEKVMSAKVHFRAVLKNGRQVIMSEILKIIQDRHSSRVPFDQGHLPSKHDLMQILEPKKKI